MKYVLVGCLLMLCQQAQAAYNPDFSICEIRVDNRGGSGTLIGVTNEWALVLTARHVAGNAGAKASITWPSTGERMDGEVIKVVSGNDTASDMALIICKRPDKLQPIPIAKFDPRAGPWRSVGYRDHHFYESFADEAHEENGAIRLNAPFIQGQSGGAVLDRNGHLVGIIVSSDLRTFGRASDGLHLQKLIEGVR